MHLKKQLTLFQSVNSFEFLSILKTLLQKGHTIVKRPQIDQTTRDKLTEPVAASTLEKDYDADYSDADQ